MTTSSLAWLSGNRAIVCNDVRLIKHRLPSCEGDGKWLRVWVWGRREHGREMNERSLLRFRVTSPPLARSFPDGWISQHSTESVCAGIRVPDILQS